MICEGHYNPNLLNFSFVGGVEKKKKKELSVKGYSGFIIQNVSIKKFLWLFYSFYIKSKLVNSIPETNIILYVK